MRTWISFLFIFFLSTFQVFADDDWVVIGAQPETCAQGSYSTTDRCTGTPDTSQPTQFNSDAAGFSWTASKSFSMWGVSVYVDHTSDGVLTCRIDTDADLSSGHDAECTTSTITGDGYVDCEWSAGCIDITSSQTYYIGCTGTGTLYSLDNDGACNNNYYAAASSGWNMDNNDAQDIEWRAIEDD